MEEDGVIPEEAEKLCKHAIPMVVGREDSIWCGKTCLICYKTLDEECEQEEFDIQPIV